MAAGRQWTVVGRLGEHVHRDIPCLELVLQNMDGKAKQLINCTASSPCPHLVAAAGSKQLPAGGAAGAAAAGAG